MKAGEEKQHFKITAAFIHPFIHSQIRNARLLCARCREPEMSNGQQHQTLGELHLRQVRF